MKTDFVGLGYCSNDHLCVVPHIPENSKVEIIQNQVTGGGPAANASVAAARLGVKAAFIGTVGDDDDGRTILRDFQNEGVSTDAVAVRAGAGSAIAYCWIDARTGNRSIAWTRSGLRELEASEVDLTLVRGARIFHMDGHHPQAALAGAKAAKESGTLVSFDAGTLRDGVRELLPLSDLLICSEEFAKQLTGIADAEAAVRKIYADWRPRVAGVTMGNAGSMAFDGRTLATCPAFSVVPVVDTTGCGDLFHAGFAVRYLDGAGVPECLRFGAAVAALKTKGLGGRTAAPSRTEVDDFLNKGETK